MPSMSRPQTAKDMDLLKSLLKTESNNSEENTDEEQDTDKKDPPQSVSSAATSSSSSLTSSSSSKPGDKDNSRSKSPADVPETGSVKSSGTFWSDIDQEQKPNDKNSNTRSESNLSWYEKKEKSDDEDTQSYQYSSFSSLASTEKTKNDNVTKSFKKKENRTKKSKKNAKKKYKMKSKTVYEDDFESDEDSNQTDLKDRSIRIDLGESSTVPKKVAKSPKESTEKATLIQQFYSNRTTTKHRRNTLTNRAKDTLHLYPATLGRPDRLETNYKELQRLLEDQFIKYEDNLNKQIVRDTRQTLNNYKHYQQGYVGSMRPPSGQGQQLRRPRLWSAHTEPSSVHTQADMDEEYTRNKQRRPQSAKGHYFIDTTRPEMRKKVSFVHEHARVSSFLGSEDETTKKISGGKVMQKRRINRSLQRQTHPRNRSQTRSRSPNKTDGKSGSESSRSRSRSRSHTPERKTDHHLKHSGNPKLHEWLKEKNKMHRRKMRDERKKDKLKKKEEAEAEKVKLKRQEQIDDAVRKWMKEKQKGTRLLKKRPTNRENDDVIISNDDIAINETVDLQNGETVSPKEMDENEDDAKSKEHTESVREAATEEGTTGEDKQECTCGFAEHPTLTGDTDTEMMNTLKLRLEKEAKRQANRKPRPPSSKKLNVNPSSASGKITLTISGPSDDSKKRLSYENWIKQKNKEDIEKRKRDKKKAEQSLSDPEADAIVSDVARKRIDNIMQQRTKIDTGIKSVDVEANKSLGDKKNTPRKAKTGRAEEVAPSTETSVRYYRWTGNKTVDTKRPVSAHITSGKEKEKDSNSKRPDSAGSPIRSSEERRSRSASPKPKTKTTKAYSSVKYQRRSWDEFSDYVWDKLNEGEGEIKDADVSDHSETLPRPEPQGADDVTSAVTDPDSRPEVANTSVENKSVTTKSVDPSESLTSSPEQGDTDKDAEQKAGTNRNAVESSSMEGADVNKDGVSNSHTESEIISTDNTERTEDNSPDKTSECEPPEAVDENMSKDGMPECTPDHDQSVEAEERNGAQENIEGNLESDHEVRKSSSSMKKVRFSEQVEEHTDQEYVSDQEGTAPNIQEPASNKEPESDAASGEPAEQSVEADSPDGDEEPSAVDQNSEEPTSVFLTS